MDPNFPMQQYFNQIFQENPEYIRSLMESYNFQENLLNKNKFVDPVENMKEQLNATMKYAKDEASRNDMTNVIKDNYQKLLYFRRLYNSWEMEMREKEKIGHISVVNTFTLNEKEKSCKKDLKELKKVFIGDLEINKINYGMFIEGVIFHDAYKIAGIFTLIKDEKEDIERIGIYNVGNLSLQKIRKIFKKNTKIIIKEPYLKKAKDGQLVIRIDFPEEIVIVQKKEKDKINLKKSERIRVEGNEVFGKKLYEEASWLYEKAIRYNPNEVRTYSNLALCNLMLKRYYKAYEMAKKAIEIDKNFIKGYFHLIESLHGIKRYDEAKEVLEKTISFNKEIIDEGVRKQNEKSLEILKNKNEKLIGNREGKFNFSEIIKNNDNLEFEIGDYFNKKLESRLTEDKGYGIFCTEDINKGELLCVENAFEISSKIKKDYNFSFEISIKTNTQYRQDTIDLRDKIYEKIRDEPELLKTIYTLGNFKKDYRLEERKTQAYDSQAIFDIILYCAYNNESIEKDSCYSHSGLWIFCGLFNHSCDPNVNFIKFGRFFIIKANRNIKKNEQLFINYIPLEKDFKQRKKHLENWKFECKCERCSYEENNSNLLKKYYEFLNKFEMEIKKNAKSKNFNKMLKFENKINLLFDDLIKNNIKFKDYLVAKFSFFKMYFLQFKGKDEIFELIRNLNDLVDGININFLDFFYVFVKISCNLPIFEVFSKENNSLILKMISKFVEAKEDDLKKIKSIAEKVVQKD